MNFLVLQHLSMEPAGQIGEAISEAGHSLDTVHLDRGDAVPASLEGYDGLIVMGGAMSANDTFLPYISDEIALLKRVVASDFPVLGICLGAQLLAKAAGAEVVASPERELGWYRVCRTRNAENDPLFGRLEKSGLPVFQWHGETFTLPDSAMLLVTSPHVPHQAFRIGSSQYGLQFHIEVDEATIESWIETGASERRALGEDGVEVIRKETSLFMPQAHEFCAEMTKAWLAAVMKRS